jgi:hypothetical protein
MNDKVKKCGRKRSRPISSSYVGICLKGLRKTMTVVFQSGFEPRTSRIQVHKRWGLNQFIFIFSMLLCYTRNMSRDSLVVTATGYGLDGRGVGVRVPVGSRIFSSPRRPDRLWGPPNLLCKAYWGFFP